MKKSSSKLASCTAWVKWAICVIGVILALTGSSPAQMAPELWSRDYPNLAYNASFEAADWTNPNIATLWQDRTYLTRTTETSHGGVYSYRATDPLGLAGVYTFQIVNLLPSTTYTIAGWVKTQGLTNNRGGAFAYIGPGTFQTAWSGSTAVWKEVSLSFTTTSNPGTGWIRLVFDTNPSAIVWIDDVRLVPANPVVPTAPAPTITPGPGAYDGPQQITLSTTLAGATIRYTIDGSDPHPFSVLYTPGKPFRLSGSARVRARAFHTCYRESPVTEANIILNPTTTGGVPFNGVGWGQDVETWWAAHQMNPDSPNHFTGVVQNPAPIINVADVRDANPATTTAGIEEALAQIPTAGGTLYFPGNRGPYSVSKQPVSVDDYYDIPVAIPILRRSNLHFIGDAGNPAVIQYTRGSWDLTAPSGNSGGILAFSSMEIMDSGVFSKPITNFYFHNLIFDGGGVTPGCLVFRHCAQVLAENCVFRNTNNAATGHPGAITAASCADNVWARNCTFSSGVYAIYFDGMHDGGLVNCSINGRPILSMTNNDMALYSAGQRCTQYLVLDRCNWTAPTAGNAISLTAANCLVTHCTTNPGVTLPVFVAQTGRGASNIVPFLWYDGAGIKVINNQIPACGTFVSFGSDCTQHTWSYDMRSAVRNNTVGSAATFISLDAASMTPGAAYIPAQVISGLTVSDNVVSGGLSFALDLFPTLTGGRIDDVLLKNNNLTGSVLPQVRVKQPTVSQVMLQGNDFFGVSQALLLDQTGGTLPAGAILFNCNRSNGAWGACVITGDYNSDHLVDAADLTGFAAQWLLTGPGLVSDFHVDSHIDLLDFDLFQQAWTGPDLQPPSVPANLTLQLVMDTRIQLSWTPALDNIAVANYRVYRNGSGTPLATTAGPSYLNTGLTPLTAYTYRVTALDAAGNESPLSDPLAVTTLAPLVNLLSASANPGFETESTPGSGRPANWQERSYATGTFGRDATVANSGAASLKISGNWTGSSGPYTFNQVLKDSLAGVISPGHNYALGGWIKAAGVAGNGGNFQIALASAGTFDTSWLKTSDWTYVEKTFTPTGTVGPSGSLLKCQWTGLTAGTVWFDDVILYQK